ncbi:hypothetical protein AB0O28_36460 [Microbispora sp. NPDC088329]|uniref:hypothetical protein n=1 Tax=Microbispora sp. NPDC088329 TaxID=3154869 RepID=UPI00342A98A8
MTRQAPRTAPDVLAPVKPGPVTLRNRIKAATCEGLSRESPVTDELVVTAFDGVYAVLRDMVATRGLGLPRTGRR